MNIKMLRILAISSLFLSMLMWPAAAPAQVVICSVSPPASSATVDDVIVDTGLCTLDDVTVRGSVLVSGDGRLTATGGTEVRGSIKVDSGGTIGPGAVAVNLPDATVLGDVTLKDSGNVTVGTATIGALKVERSGAVNLDGATIFPGGVSVKEGMGSLVICGSKIGINGGDGGGGVIVSESGIAAVPPTTMAIPFDVLAVEAGPCAASEIDGSVIVEKGVGSVRLVGATLNSDLIVIEQTGNVEVKDPPTSLSDVKVAKLFADPVDPSVVGDVDLTNVTTDSDTTIVDIDGDVTIGSTLGGDVEIKLAGDVTMIDVTTSSDTTIVDNSDVTIDSSSLGGDVKIESNKIVMIKKNSFSLEDVLISSNDGPVMIDKNCDMRLTVIDNNNVMITNNNPTDATTASATCVSGFGFSDADVSKNTGGVSIVDNTGEKLHCSDNVPPPTGSSNSITEKTGQCAGV